MRLTPLVTSRLSTERVTNYASIVGKRVFWNNDTAGGQPRSALRVRVDEMHKKRSRKAYPAELSAPLCHGLVHRGGKFRNRMNIAGYPLYPAVKDRSHFIEDNNIAKLACFIGYVTAPFASRAWHLYLTQGALVGSGIGFVIVPSTAVLSQWFSKRRSMANGISSAGSGVRGAAFTWGTAAMIKLQGLDWALRATGIITLVGIVIATLLLRHRNSQIQPNQRAFDIALLRSRAVALLLMWAFTTMFGYVVLLFSLSEFALAIGLSRKQATDIVGFLNVGTAIGRPLIGLVSDRFSRVATACVLTLLCGLICFVLWLPATSFGLTLFFSILCGAILGVFWMTIGPLSAEVAGIQNLQATLSLAWAATILPAASAEVIALMLQGLPAPRTYVYPQVFAGLAYIIASGFLAALWINLRHRDSASQTRRLPGGIAGRNQPSSTEPLLELIQPREDDGEVLLLREEEPTSHHEIRETDGAGNTAASSSSAPTDVLSPLSDSFDSSNSIIHSGNRSEPLETSCDKAAEILVEFHSQTDPSWARSALGCHGDNSCSVKNTKIFQLMDHIH
ncbi:hypothetical protein FOVSG1_000185 [Fusarium oxysporum f. sp. vasinfectum]